MKISVLRIGHRLVRDDRVTTHVALVSRAFGADMIYMTGVDESVRKTMASVSERWGGDFKVEVIEDWKALARTWKKQGGKVSHLTMYGINIDDVVDKLRKESRLLVIIGAEKVPREAYDIADYNIAIGHQPHSEIAALAIFLDRIFNGMQLKKEYPGGRLRIIPSENGKNIQESK